MEKPIIIEAPRTGIANSPHLGNGDIRNLDIFSIPGVVKLNGKLALVSGTTVDATINWFVRDPVTTTNCYALDSNGVIYRSTNSGVTWTEFNIGNISNAHGNGLAIWEDYLFVARDTSLDVYGPLLSGKTFTVTIASPGVFTITGHGLAFNDRVVFSTSGALPTGLTAGTVYYVIAGGLTADEFEVSTAQGGAAVNTSGSQSGTHKCRAMDFAWQTIDSDVLWHPMFVSKLDNKLYIGAANYLDSLEELTTFAASGSDGVEYNWVAQALDIPSPYRIKCLEELGNNLMMGTWKGTNVNEVRIADIFTWDGSSPTWGQPIQIDDYGVHAMKVINGNLIVLAGFNGTIRRCDGVNAPIIGKVPFGDTGIFYFYPGALCGYKDKIFFGIGNSSTIGGMGIYSLYLTDKGGILNLEHLNKALTDGSVAETNVTALLPLTYNSLNAGCKYNDTDFGIDLSGSTYSYSTDYSGYWESALYVIGDYNNKRKFTEVSFVLAKELATDEGIKIKYRVNLTDSFTTIKEFTYTLLGAITSYVHIVDIPASETIQFRIELKGTSSTTPQLRMVVFK